MRRNRWRCDVSTFPATYETVFRIAQRAFALWLSGKKPSLRQNAIFCDISPPAAINASMLKTRRISSPTVGITHGRPFGGERWVQKTAASLGLQTTLRPRGGPKKKINASG